MQKHALGTLSKSRICDFRAPSQNILSTAFREWAFDLPMLSKSLQVLDEERGWQPPSHTPPDPRLKTLQDHWSQLLHLAHPRFCDQASWIHMLSKMQKLALDTLNSPRICDFRAPNRHTFSTHNRHYSPLLCR